ncbi:MAG: DNA-processing protein DprA [bacterium]|nr:DNA-processing protein DprA [bacterium]
MSDLEAWVTLNMIDGLGYSKIGALVNYFGTPRRVLQAKMDELMKVDGVGKILASHIINARKRISAEHEIDKAQRLGAKILSLDDPDYPVLLRHIFSPPLVLYVKGEVKPEDSVSLAVIGSRFATSYGKSITHKLVRGLVEKGVTIVSGAARGIDSVAHLAAIASGGRTLAVLGSGIDVPYPPENKHLMEDIAKQGAVLTEFPIGTAPLRFNFPRRNRIISGLSLGVVVVEAAERSGALITARFAAEQGREVFAVPGQALGVRSRGTNRLIKEGAKLVEGVEDIIEEFSDIFSGLRKEREIEKKKVDMLEGHDEEIYNLITSESKHIDQIVRECALPVSQVWSTLLNLEMKGLIRQLRGKFFLRT